MYLGYGCTWKSQKQKYKEWCNSQRLQVENRWNFNGYPRLGTTRYAETQSRKPCCLVAVEEISTGVLESKKMVRNDVDVLDGVAEKDMDERCFFSFSKTTTAKKVDAHALRSVLTGWRTKPSAVSSMKNSPRSLVVLDLLFFRPAASCIVTATRKKYHLAGKLIVFKVSFQLVLLSSKHFEVKLSMKSGSLSPRDFKKCLPARIRQQTNEHLCLKRICLGVGAF